MPDANLPRTGDDYTVWADKSTEYPTSEDYSNALMLIWNVL